MKKPRQVFFRLCHCCNQISSQVRTIDKCRHCDKSFAKFFFFDEHSVAVYSDSQARPQLLAGRMEPIRGLSAVWTEWNDDSTP